MKKYIYLIPVLIYCLAIVGYKSCSSPTPPPTEAGPTVTEKIESKYNAVEDSLRRELSLRDDRIAILEKEKSEKAVAQSSAKGKVEAAIQKNKTDTAKKEDCSEIIAEYREYAYSVDENDQVQNDLITQQAEKISIQNGQLIVKDVKFKEIAFSIDSVVADNKATKKELRETKGDLAKSEKKRKNGKFVKKVLTAVILVETAIIILK